MKTSSPLEKILTVAAVITDVIVIATDKTGSHRDRRIVINKRLNDLILIARDDDGIYLEGIQSGLLNSWMTPRDPGNEVKRDALRQ
tara:strand:+ start:420 stop:677 length:258 start_codon:yes stop_codon:yes gene_type:complete